MWRNDGLLPVTGMTGSGTINLLERECRVRATVRQEEHCSSALATAGGAVEVADSHDLTGMVTALRNAQDSRFCRPGPVEATTFAQAAVDAVRCIVASITADGPESVWIELVASTPSDLPGL